MLPRPVRSLGRSVAGLLPEAPSTGWREALRKARVGHGLVDAEAYVQGPFADVLPASPSLEPWNLGIGNDAEAMMAADLAGQLAGQMLPKTDNMTMAASLECRVPLLDLELVDLAARAPLAWKREARVGKVPLRQLLARHLPSQITDRPKHGFRVPLTSWFGGPIAGELRERFDVVIADPPAFIKRKKDFKNGEAAYRRLNEQAMRLLNKDGILVSASCSMHLPEDDLQNILLGSARHLDRNIQLLERGGQGPDHPVHPAIAETRYIKSLTVRLLPNA